MKKLGVLICVLFVLKLLFSEPVLLPTIEQVAANWLYLQTGQVNPHIPISTPGPNAPNHDYWIVEYGYDTNNDDIPDYVNGWVVVSADDSCIPILAFCTQGSYTLDPVNEAAEELLSEYSHQIEDAKTNQSNTETRPIWDAIINQTISISEEHDTGLFTEEMPQWGVHAQYNMYCPWDDVNHPGRDDDDQIPDYHTERSVVGCVATAVAQICNYHKRWNFHEFGPLNEYISIKNGFTCEIDSDSIDYDFPNFSTLNAYMEEVENKFNSNTPLTIEDKAALSFACGILVEMKYSSLGSEAGCGSAVYDKMNMYYQSACAADIDSNEDWIDLIRTQLLHDRPIEYHGNNINGGGHAYVITGFQTTNMNTTLNLVNWGRPWCHREYWSLQILNPASPYPYDHYMLFRIAPNAAVTQTILLENGSTDYSGIQIHAASDDGISKTITSDNAVFEFGLPPGTYHYTITDTGNYFFPYQIDGTITQTGINHISPNPIVLTLKPNVVVVPTDVPTIQEGIDLVRNGGTVAMLNGSYTVSGLNWQEKHIKLQGQSQSGVVLTNDPNTNLPAIQLSEVGNGIDNRDIISQITFRNCDLTESTEPEHYRRGAAIETGYGAAPIITNCTFDNNRVGNPATSGFPYWRGTGGAVCIGGNSVTQTNTTKLVNCTFTDNYTLNGTGGGALVIYGQAQITGCEFTGNKTIITDGIENPFSKDLGGAVLIYPRLNLSDIDIEFDNCVFSNNKSRSEADDVFVANTEKLNTLRFNGCTFTADTPHSNGAKPAMKFLTDANNYSANMHAHLILTNNKFLSSRQGAVYLCDYHGKNSLTFTGNVVANNMYDGYGVYSWYPDGTPPSTTDYYVFDNNTFSNIAGSGLILYQCPATTINNNVFENCSSYGISWGDYEDNHPDWATRGLTIYNSLFSSSSTKYDFEGSDTRPLEEYSVNSVQDMYLDSNYQPIWNSTIMSPCIDTGIGENDPVDKTPPDIGARRAIAHRYWSYTFSNQSDAEKWYWVSYPVLNSVTDGMLQASEFYDELLQKQQVYENDEWHWTPTYLEEIDWMIPEGLQRILWAEQSDDWTPNQSSHYVISPQGYKIKLIPGTRSVTLKESGFRTPSDTPFPIHGGVENWLGYFRETASWPHEAFATIWDDINMIKTKDWCMIRARSDGDYWGMSGKVRPLEIGDMLIVTTDNDHNSFQWNNANATPPESKSAPEHFVFNEKPDYVPVYVSIPDSIKIDLKEIGLYLDGICKGAVVVEDSLEQICAYLDIDEKLEDGIVEFVFYYNDNKAGPQESKRIHLDSSRLSAQYIKGNRRYPYYNISLSAKDMDNVIPIEFALGQNYPNPFNPTTTIRYQLKEPGKVYLEIYNLRGQLVKSLVVESQEAGYHSMVWNGTDNKNRNVASGVYLYRLKCGNNVQTKRMLLMK